MYHPKQLIKLIFPFVPILFIVPCCPENVSVTEISWESLMIVWTAVRGAELYEIQATDPSNYTVLCNDTSPMCVLSDLNCNTWYSVLVSPCNEARGCNRSCRPRLTETSKKKTQAHTFHYCALHSGSEHLPFLSQLPVCLREWAWFRLTPPLSASPGQPLTKLPTIQSLWLDQQTAPSPVNQGQHPVRWTDYLVVPPIRSSPLPPPPLDWACPVTAYPSRQVFSIDLVISSAIDLFLIKKIFIIEHSEVLAISSLKNFSSFCLH